MRLVFLLCSLLSVAFAQNINLRGEVRVAEGWDPIPYAVIRLPGTSLGSVANAEGSFTLSVPPEYFQPDQRIEVSSLGYQTVQLPITELSRARINLLRLPDQAYVLSEVFILATELTPAQMVAQAFRKLPDNYPAEPYLMRTFYRHYCQENGRYGRLIEAALDLYDREGHGQLVDGPDDKIEVRLNQLRRSLDFTRLAAYQHAPIALFRTLANDPASYPTPLSRTVDRAKMTFRIADTTIYQGQPVLMIHADGSYRGWRYLADIYLVVGCWAIVKLEEHWARTEEKRHLRVNLTNHFVTSYQPLGDRWVLSRQLNEGRREELSLDDEGQVWHRRTHQHRVELMVNEVLTEGFTPFTGPEPYERLMQQVKYDPGFWENYTVLASTPLENRIEKDLSARWDLEQQFLSFNRDPDAPEVQELRAERQLQQLQADYAGYPMLLVFWDHAYEPSWRDLWRVRRLLQKAPQDPLGLVFISLDEDQGLWQRAIREKKLTVGEHLRLGQGLRSPLAQRYGVSEVPYLVVLDRSQKVLWQGSQWPSHREVEAIMAQWGE